MARAMKRTTVQQQAPIVSSKMNITVAEKKANIMSRDKINFDKAIDALKKLSNVSKPNSRTISTFDRETLANYLENIGSSEQQLRNISWYLYYRSQVYRRICNYYANMFDLKARIINPKRDLIKPANDNDLLKSFNDTINQINKMDLEGEFRKIFLTCFIQDVFYGVAYVDDQTFFVLPLDPDYCRIAGVNLEDSSFDFAMNMSYFTGTNSYLLDDEYWGEPFASMYKAYNGNSSEKWQIVPHEYSVCLKYGTEDYRTIVPPLSGSLLDLVQLEDIKNISALADEQEIFKLIYYPLETISGSKMVDDWKVDPDLAQQYLARLINEALPDYTTAVMSPGELKTIDFSNNNKSDDVSKIEKATEAVLNIAGGSEVLNGATISGAEAMRIAQRVNTTTAISSLLPQAEIIINRLIQTVVKNACKVEFFRVSYYTEDDLKENLMSSLQSGFISNALAYNTMNGISEQTTLSLLYFNNNVLHLQDMMTPLQTSYTTSNKVATGETTKEGGRPIENGEATDEADGKK